MTDTTKTQVMLRIPEDLITEVDRRREQASASTGKSISRNQWFVNMTRWVVEELPHHAVRSDLIAAWPDMPDEALGIDGSNVVRKQ